MNYLLNGMKNFFREPIPYILNLPNTFQNFLKALDDNHVTGELISILLERKEELISTNVQYKPYLEYIENTGDINSFNMPFVVKYQNINIKIYYDKIAKLKYVIHNGKKLYYPSNVKKNYIISAYKSVLCEQDIESPHRYLNYEEDLKDYVVFDCGTAEASLSLDLVEVVKHIYLFEAEKMWEEPLKNTFSQWKDKITFINKYVGNGEKNTISLGEYIKGIEEKKEIDLENDKIFIKMDIEGAEEDAIKTLIDIMQRGRNIKMAICVYHRQQAENFIRNIIPREYYVKERNGYMLFWNNGTEFPYFRHGVIRIER